ncbi:Low-density lipoprotein receptor-related protein 1B [Mactra antiquata]
MKFLFAVIVGVSITSLVVKIDAGIIAGTYDDWGWGYDPAQIRYFHEHPGIDDNMTYPSRLVFSKEDEQVISIDNDYRKKLMYLYDKSASHIWIANNFSQSLNTDDMNFKIMHYVMSSGTPQLAYDWLSGTLYWCDTHVRTIFAAPGDWDKVDKDYYRIISHAHFDNPDGIGIDPLEGYLFIIDGGPSPKLARMNTDGTDGHTIVTEDMTRPSTVEVDIADQTVYWLDVWMDTLESVDYDGKTRRLLLKFDFAILYDIAVFQDMVYITETFYEILLTYNKHTMEKAAEDISLSDIDETIYSVSIYDEEAQPLLDQDYCGVLNCEHMCLSQVHGAVCACAEGYKLSSDGKTCEERYGSLNKAFVYANESHVCLVDIRSVKNFGKFKPKCVFTMIEKVRTTTAAPTTTQTTTTTTPTTTTTTTTIPVTTSTTNDTDNETNTTTSVFTRPTRPTLPPTTTVKPPPTVAPMDAIKMFELDMRDRYIFVVTQDNRILKRSLQLEIDSETVLQVSQQAVDITGISFDPMDRNLYWSLSNGQIFEYNVDEDGTKDITIAERPESPKDLHVLIDQRKLSFISGDYDIKTIEFDGTGIQNIATHSDLIYSLVLDREKRLFYFLSDDQMFSVPLSGEEEPTTEHYYLNDDTTLFRLYHNYAIWLYKSNDKPNILESALLTNLYYDTSIGSFDNVSTIVDLKILDYQLQETKPGLCTVDNGGCAHFCFSKLVHGNLEKVCECKKGFIVDGSNCTSTPLEDNFLIFLDWTTDEILQFDLNNFSLYAIPVRESYLYMGIFLDQETKRLIWSVYYESEVFSSRLDGYDTKLVADIGYSYPHKFAKDYSTGNLYYFSYYNQHLGMITPKGHNLWFDDDFYWDTIRCIDIHPGLGKMYYGIYSYGEGYIGRADLDGTNHEVLIDDDWVVDPRGMAIDYINKHLYIGDYKMDTIFRCDLEGQNCITIVNTTDSKMLELETDGEYLYYSSTLKGYIVRVGLTPPYETQIIGENNGLGRINTFSVYRSNNLNKQPVQNACSPNGGLGDCSTICVPKPNGRVCMCQDKVHLRPDGITCSDVHQCDEIFDSLSNGTNTTIEIVLEHSCLRRAGHVCEFKCPINYVPLNSSVTSLTCINNEGWDLQNETLCVELKCPTTFSGGYVGDDCSRLPGRACNFTCDFGSVRKQKQILCQYDGTWHGLDDGVCETYRCSADIKNGIIDPNCTRTLGETCNYRCDKYYEFAPTVRQTLTCGNDGWDMDTKTLCIVTACSSSTLQNGMVETGCNRTIGHPCKYSCNRAFMNTSVGIYCNLEKQWHPANACEHMYCPMQIDNGMVAKNCSRRVDSICQYYCDKFYVKSNIVSVQCLANGQWNQTKNLCLEPEPKKEALTEGQKNGLIAGVVILVIIVLILAIATFSLFKSRKSSSRKYVTASYKHDSQFAIENPGYVNTTNLEVKDDHTYDGLDTSQTDPAKFSGQSASGNETLSEVPHVDVTNDLAALTHDSWLKERQTEQQKL